MFNTLLELIASRPLPFFISIVVLGGTWMWACLFIFLRFLIAYRKLTNAERMQMIEAGQSSELLKSYESQLRRNRFLSLSLGLFVPCTALVGATLVSICTQDQFAISLVAWICAALASVASTICGTIVMVRQYDLN